jgi:hypothetical protein
MVRGSLNKLLSVAGKWQTQQLRRLNIHEYQVSISLSIYSFIIILNHVFVDDDDYEICCNFMKLKRFSFSYTVTNFQFP